MTLQVTCPNCGKRVSVLDQQVGQQVQCGSCSTLISVAAPKPNSFSGSPARAPASVQEPLAASPSSRSQPSAQPSSSRSNVWIVAGAVFFCALAAIAFGVIATIQVGMNRGTFVLGTGDGGEPADEGEDGDVDPLIQIAVDRGYTFEMPRGFYPLERIEKNEGEVCYTFASEQDASAGCLMCVTPKRGASVDSEPPLIFAPAPPNFPAPVVQINGIYYLEEDRTEKLRVDGMSAFIHRIEYQRKRGGRTISTIGWFMHAMDDGQFVTIRITQAEDTSVSPPKQWRAALLSLRRHRPPNETLIPDQFRPRASRSAFD